MAQASTDKQKDSLTYTDRLRVLAAHHPEVSKDLLWIADEIDEERDAALVGRMSKQNDYAASLRQQAAWVREGLSIPEGNFDLGDVDTEELDAAANEIDRLTAAIAAAEEQYQQKVSEIGKLIDQIASREAALVGMRAVLKPFAELADAYGSLVSDSVIAGSTGSWKDEYAEITIGDLRRAKSSLSPGLIDPPREGPSPSKDGWIEWNGGECPCPGVPVAVKYRNGVEDQLVAEYFRWDHSGRVGDIIAYRLTVPREEK